MMCFHWPINRKLESTSAVKEGWGLLYRPTSPKAVTRREPLFAFFTKKEGFRYSIEIPTSSGPLKTPNSSSSSNFCCNSTSLSHEYWGSRPFLLGGFDGSHIHFGFKGARSTVVAFDFRIEHVVKLVKSCTKLNRDIDGQEIHRIETDGAGMNVFFWHWLLS